MDYKLVELINTEHYEKLSESFYAITKVAHDLLDECGNIIFSHGLKTHDPNNENQLEEIHIPITIENEQIATFVFRLKSNDNSLYKTYFESMAAMMIETINNKLKQIELDHTVTKLTQVEKNLLDNEQQQRMILENLPVMVDAVDENGMYIVWNRECELITGYTQDEIIGNPQAFEMLYPNVGYRNHLFDEFVERGNNFRDWDMTLTCKDGSLKTISWFNISEQFPVPGWQFWAVGVDVTERKKAKEKLKQKTAELESIFRAIPDLYFLMDIDGTIVDCKAKDPSDFYVPEEEFMWKKVQDVLPTEVGQQFIDAFDEIKRTNTLVMFECSLPMKGQKTFYEVRCIPLTENIVVVIVQNITERKCMEENLRIERNIKAAILDTVEALIVAFDTEGHIMSFNRASEKISGYSFEEVKEKNFQDIFLIDEDIEKVATLFQDLKEGQAPIYFENYWLTKSGEKKLISWSNSILYDENDQIKYIIGTGKDITEQRRTEELLRKSEKLSAVGQLAAGVAHEVRNPLTVLKGFIQLLSTSEINENYYNLMLHEIEHIETIISEFLSLAKPEVLRLEQKNLIEIIKNVVTLLNTKAIMTDINITFEDYVPLYINCHASQMKQVFINILQNSIEAMPNGGNILVSLEESEKEVTIRFLDQGCGIPKQRLRHLGEPFYSTKEKGTGLGLMISYKIIESHKGKINIVSKENKGTIVEVTLPTISYT
ncbi:PAS domain S-box protein [Microbacteriaceae bacterium 4G12]